MNRRTFLTALSVTALGGLGVTACSSGTGAAPAAGSGGAGKKLTMGLTYTPDIQFAPMYVAAEKGHFAAEGLDITLRHHGASEALFGALTDGTEQIVYAGGDEMMQARSQGVPVINFATLYQKYPVVLLTREESPIKTAADLKGRSVGVPGPYGETWFGLLALLRQAGLSQDDVQIKHIGYTQQAALTTNQVEAVMGYSNNDAVRFAAAGIGVRSLPIAEDEPPLVGIGLGTTDELVRSAPEDLKAVNRAVRKGITDLVADPEGAVEASKKYVPNLAAAPQAEAALATLRATIPLFGEPAEAGRQDPARWDRMAAFLQEMGLLAKPVPATEAFTAALLG